MAGYIGPAPVPQATQNREAFTATSNQTSFATLGYTPGFIDVYLNGVKLAAADYTATNGSDVVLASGAASGDILEVVAFSAFTVADQTFTGTTTAANLTVTGAFTSQGIDDNANAVAITIDSSENVGIGTSSPSNSLTVNSGTTNVVAKFISTDADAQIHFEDNSTTDIVGIGATGDNLEYRTDQGVHLFRTGNSAAERMRIDSSGNVGIGGITSLSDKLHLRTATGSVGLRFNVDDAGDFRIVNDGSSNLTFISGASTERMRIDSSGNVGIGESNPDGRIDISVSSTNERIHTVRPAGGSGSPQFGFKFRWGDDADSPEIGLLHGGSYADAGLYFDTMSGGSKVSAMRITSDGNLLLGKTAIGNDVGAEFRSIGYSSFTRDGNNVLTVRRKTSDGDIVQFEKDTTVVGSIRSYAGARLGIGSNGGAGFIFGGSQAYPATDGSLVDNTHDLGSASYRWKDLYLSGDIAHKDAAGNARLLYDKSANLLGNAGTNLYGAGIYLGGTGSANKLEDYEEGTFAPTVGSSGWVGVYQSSNKGAYVKTGNCVNFNLSLDLTSTSTQPTGNVIITGLPFASHSNSHSQGSPRFTLHFYNAGFGSASSSIPLGYIPTTSSTQVKILYSRDGNTWVVANHGGSANQINFGSGRMLIVVNGHYFTDA